jgi:hypothetical protein
MTLNAFALLFDLEWSENKAPRIGFGDGELRDLPHSGRFWLCSLPPGYQLSQPHLFLAHPLLIGPCCFSQSI